MIINFRNSIIINVDALRPYELIIESPLLLRDTLSRLMHVEEAEEALGVSDEGQRFHPGKMLDFILNPLIADCQCKSIVNKLYRKLEEVGIENPEEYSDISLKISEYIDFLSIKSGYPVVVDIPASPFSLLKAFNVGFGDSGDAIEKLVDYCRLSRDLLGKNVVITCGLKTVFSKAEVARLYDALVYEQLVFIDIEAMEMYSEGREKRIIYDCDLCRIAP